jgi:hypothetical protein
MPATTVKEPASRFEIARAELLSARAALAEVCAKTVGEPDDDPLNAALDAEIAAEWKLLQTPARNFAEIQDRARIVLEMFTQSGGPPTDNRNMLMLSALVSEILKYHLPQEPISAA